MEQLNPIQTAVYEGVKKFVQRQAIVLEALKDLRPDLVMRVRNDIDPKELARLRQEHEPLRDAIFSILEELQGLGLLSRDEQYYTLIVKE